MARAIAAGFLVTAAVAVLGVLLLAIMARSGGAPGVSLAFFVGAPVVLGLLAAWMLPGAWPSRTRPLWTGGVGILVVLAIACGLALGGFVGVYAAFATGLFVIGW